MPLPGPTNLSPPYSSNLTNEAENVPAASQPKVPEKVGTTSEITVGATSETHSWVSTVFEGEKLTNID